MKKRTPSSPMVATAKHSPKNHSTNSGETTKSIPTRVRVLLGILAAAVVLLLVSIPLRKMLPNERQRIRLDSVAGDLDVGLVGRSLMLLPAGECVIFSYAPTAVNDDYPQLQQFLESGRGKKHQDPPGTYWGDRQLHPQTLSTFNCATYAVGEEIGLTERDWLSTDPTGASFYSVPLEVVLNSYYRPVVTVDGPDADRGEGISQLLSAAQSKDVVCFYEATDATPLIVHVGKIQATDGQLWVISKLGNGPIVRASLKDTIEFYRHEGAVHQLKLYRKHRSGFK